jgi:virginiamycin B lyase
MSHFEWSFGYDSITFDGMDVQMPKFSKLWQLRNGSNPHMRRRSHVAFAKRLFTALASLGCVGVLPTATSASPSTSANNTFVVTASSARDVLASGSFLYWTNSWAGTIGRSNLDGTGVNQNFITGLVFPSGLDIEGNFLYFSSFDLLAGASEVGRANIDGTGVNSNFITGGTGTTGIEATSSFLYWSNSENNTIGRSNLDGTNVNQSFILTGARPWNVVANNTTLYWTNTNNNSIGSSNLAGTNVNQAFLVLTGAEYVTGLALSSTHLYWGAYNGSKIGRATLAGTNIETDFVAGTGISDTVGVSVTGNYLYWSRVDHDVALRNLPASIGRASFEPDGQVDYVGALPLSTTSIRVSWVASTTNESGFLIYRFFGGTQTLVPGCSTNTPNLTFCDDTGLLPGVAYTYGVYALNAAGAIAAPGTVVARTLAATPTAPIAAAATATGANSYRVEWVDRSSNETGFNIYRWSGTAPVLVGSASAAATFANITNASIPSTVSQVFLVSAVNTAGETFGEGYVYSAPWNTPFAGATAYLPITNATSTGLTVSWLDNATTESGYAVFRIGQNGVAVSLNGTSCPASVPGLTSCTDTGLAAGEIYQYYVYAVIGSQYVPAGSPLLYRALKPLAAPTLASVFAIRPNGLGVNWIDNATDETGYVVYEVVGGALTQVASTGPNATSVQIVGLTSGSLHVYVVAVQRGSDTRYSSAIWGVVA